MITITSDILKKISAKNPPSSITDPLASFLTKYLEKYEVNTVLRISHFLAQAAHESDGFKTMREYASGAAYEGRKDLGNIKAGDGVLFKGRGIFEITGRTNYKIYGDLIGVDLISNPKLAETPELSVLIALEYWKAKKLNILADRDDLVGITKKINGGTNGLSDREINLKRAKAIIQRVFTPSTGNGTNSVPSTPPIVNTVPISIPSNVLNITVAKRGDNSPYVMDLQNMLIKKGYSVVADGIFGQATEAVVIMFQKNNKLDPSGEIDTNTLNKLMV